MPPRKKYQTIIISQWGVLSIAASLPAIAEGQQGAEPDHEGRADGEERIDDDVALRQLRLGRQVVGRGLREQQEERVQAAQEALGVGAVELRVLEAHRLQGLDPLLGLRDELVTEAELDRVGRTRLGAGGPEPVVDAVVAERALLRGAGGLVEAHHAERARRDAVAAAVAHVLVDVDRTVLGPIDGAGRARVEAARFSAVLANVRHEQPRQVTGGLGLLDEADQTERLVGEVAVVLVGAGPVRHFQAELVPLLARDLTRPAADAQRRVREHRQRARHDYTTPFFTLHMKALVFWLYTLVSPTVAGRSLVMWPRLPGCSARPSYPQCQGTPTW